MRGEEWGKIVVDGTLSRSRLSFAEYYNPPPISYPDLHSDYPSS